MKKICKTDGVFINGGHTTKCMHYGNFSSGETCGHGEGQCINQRIDCKHGHEVQKCNVCRDKFEVRVVEEGRSIKQIMLQMTRNGCQWQSIGCESNDELRALRDAIIDYLYDSE